MFDDDALLRRTYRLPVVPLVIYLREGRSGIFGKADRVQAMTSDEDVDALLNQVLGARSLDGMNLSR